MLSPHLVQLERHCDSEGATLEAPADARELLEVLEVHEAAADIHGPLDEGLSDSGL